VPIIIVTVILVLAIVLIAKLVSATWEALTSFGHFMFQGLTHAMALALAVVAVIAVVTALIGVGLLVQRLVQWLWMIRQPPPDATPGGLTFADGAGYPVHTSPSPDRSDQSPSFDLPTRQIAHDDNEHALLALQAYVDEHPIAMSSSTVYVRHWSSERWRRSVQIDLALDAYQARVAIPEVDLSPEGFGPSLSRALKNLLARPNDGYLVRSVVDELTAVAFHPKQPLSELSITVVIPRCSRQEVLARVPAYVQLASVNSTGQLVTVRLAMGIGQPSSDGLKPEDETPEEDDDQSDAGALGAAICPAPWPKSVPPQRPGSAYWDADWARQVRAAGDLFAPVMEPTPGTETEKTAEVTSPRTHVVGWKDVGFTRSTASVPITLQPSTTSPAVAVGQRSPFSPWVARSRRRRGNDLSSTVGQVSDRRPRPDVTTLRMPVFARLEVGAHAHQGLRIFGLGRFVPAHRITASRNGAVAAGHHCQITDTTHLHVRRISLDWSQWCDAAPRMRADLRRLIADPNDSAALDRLQSLAARLTPSVEQRQAQTVSRPVGDQVDLRLDHNDVVNLGDYADLAVSHHHTVEETSLPVVGLMANDRDLILVYARALADPDKQAGFLREAVAAAGQAGDEELINAIGPIDHASSIWALFGSDRVTNAAAVTIGVDNVMSFREELQRGSIAPTFIDVDLRDQEPDIEVAGALEWRLPPFHIRTDLDDRDPGSISGPGLGF
jgi:hypothetical protein